MLPTPAWSGRAQEKRHETSRKCPNGNPRSAALAGGHEPAVCARALRKEDRLAHRLPHQAELRERVVVDLPPARDVVGAEGLRQRLLRVDRRRRAGSAPGAGRSGTSVDTFVSTVRASDREVAEHAHRVELVGHRATGSSAAAPSACSRSSPSASARRRAPRGRRSGSGGRAGRRSAASARPTPAA